jgi:murein DD-endopeptidase
MDFVAAALCLWAAAWHTPAGALVRDGVARVRGKASNTRPLLAYYSGGVYEAHESELPPELANPVPDESVLAAIPAGRALGRAAFAVAGKLEGRARAPVDALASRYQLSLASPDDAAQLLDRARADLGSDDAAVVALFVGYDVASYAVHRAKAEGNAPVFEVLVRQLPPSSGLALTSASSTLTLGTAYALSWPVAPGTRVSSPFGWRDHPILGRGQLHTGVDLAISEGTPVKVVADGVVTRASEDAVNGRVVIVDHGRGVATAYCHNSRLLVTVGQQLHAGDVISESGTTGRSTGPHLHYQLELGHRPTDPFLFRGSKPLLELPTAPTPTLVNQVGGSPTSLKRAFDQFTPPATEE